MKIKSIIKENNLERLFMKGIFGIEKESQRIQHEGTISKKDHPEEFGNRNFHPYIQTDFAESQLELVTPPTESIEETMQWLAAIHDVVYQTIPEEEYLLPFSLPSYMPTEEFIQVAKLENEEDVHYREYLVDAYGKRKQMMSGIHYNFEFHPDFLQALYQKQNRDLAYKDFQTEAYLKVAHNFLRYQWILTYLYGASILVKEEYFQNNEIPADIPNGFIRSLRSSKYGYVNKGDIHVSFESMAEYVRTIEQMVEEGKLIHEKEFYSSIRFRGGSSAREVMENGISYLEFRLFDLNPFAPYGLLAEDMQFIHYFFMQMLWMEEEAGAVEWEKGKQMNEQTAFEQPLAPSAYQAEGIQILESMKKMLQELGASNDQLELVETKLVAFHKPEQTLAGRLVQLAEAGTDLIAWGNEQAVANKANSLAQPYALTGFTDMELSTQILLFDAIQKGIHIEILDRADQFLALRHNGHLEYVKNGNMTAKDTYISPLIMENKVVTKKVLAKNGYVVPASKEYNQPEEAIADYPLFADKSFVIKPKSTNFGLGISIFREGAKESSFKEAIEIAFAEDQTVLVEDFVNGTEYRFFVIGDETKAVLLRVPANVKGDGTHTIRELVEMKNADPLRGQNHRSPLEKIQFGKIEQMTVEEQGYSMESVPPAGEIVYLRDNSNVSTGGDSIDYTDLMDESYKQIAVGITKAVGATIAGIDMMIPDYQVPSTPQNPGYGVIEANFNPMMMMHIYPYQGKSRRLTMDVLALLFPELNLSTGRVEGTE
ncbi:bifunctional glutamate--cysteine ligase GshA/glutathione synthetase GshB [Jeotgalibaca caeni]|uniref:bifunctional glutamate--cysteine ligase GshA/glutathione synthetase GshB n=1 Tax=Jeotgalibaca caeni TaxID=3028623 RepID=UPI00237EABB9|nr:bifunctional glutamate--cysteine ligase GshA/glutathione synthetase GshB [Jeotgalibaca caeni]MDE1548392.1 bifunctional glutamate--cysteine ligase GshA/glutathione synthetase GshB [Jeotgalibaca caeni]